jgi:hypothetical protein
MRNKYRERGSIATTSYGVEFEKDEVLQGGEKREEKSWI